MKQIITGLLVLCILNTYSQDYKKTLYQFNIGSNSPIPKTIKTDSNFEYKGKSGFFIDNSINYRLNYRYYFVTGINYSYNQIALEKISHTLFSTVVVFSDKSTAHVVSIPAEIKWGILQSRQLMVGFGVFGGVILSKERDITESNSTPLKPGDPINVTIYNLDSEKSYSYKKYSTYGVSLLAEYNFELEKMNLIVMSKFSYRKSEINDKSYMNRNFDYNVQFGVGVKI